MKKSLLFLLFFALCSLDAVVGDMTFSEANKESDNKKYIHIEKDGKHFWGIFSMFKNMKVTVNTGPKTSVIINFRGERDSDKKDKEDFDKVINYLSSKIEELLKQKTIDVEKISNVFNVTKKHFKLNLEISKTIGSLGDSSVEQLFYGGDFRYDDDAEELNNISIGGSCLFYIPDKDSMALPQMYAVTSAKKVNLFKLDKRVDYNKSMADHETGEWGGPLVGLGASVRVGGIKLNFSQDNYFILNDLGAAEKFYSYEILINESKIARDHIKNGLAEKVKEWIENKIDDNYLELISINNLVLIKIEGEAERGGKEEEGSPASAGEAEAASPTFRNILQKYWKRVVATVGAIAAISFFYELWKRFRGQE